MCKAVQQSKRQFISSFDIASFYAASGEKEKALEWLEKAFREHSPGMTALKVEPLFDNIRSEPQFSEILQRVGFPQ